MRYTKHGQVRGSAYTVRVDPSSKVKYEFARRKNSNDLADKSRRPWTFEVWCVGCKERFITGFVGKVRCSKCGQRFKNRNGIYGK